MKRTFESATKFLKEHPLANFVAGVTVATVAGAGLYELSQTTNSNNLPIETPTPVTTSVTTVPETVKTSLRILTATSTEPPTATPTKSPEPTATPTPTLEQMALPKLKGILASLENVNPQIGELKNYIVNLNMPLESFVNPIPGRIASGEVLVQDPNNPRAFTKLTFNIAFNSDSGKWRVVNLAKSPDAILYSASPTMSVVNFASSKRVYLNDTVNSDIRNTPTPTGINADIAVPTKTATAGTVTVLKPTQTMPSLPKVKETATPELPKLLGTLRAKDLIDPLINKGIISISLSGPATGRELEIMLEVHKRLDDKTVYLWNKSLVGNAAFNALGGKSSPLVPTIRSMDGGYPEFVSVFVNEEDLYKYLSIISGEQVKGASINY